MITIYGFGHVGKAVWRFLRDHYPVQVYDPKPQLRPDQPADKKAMIIRQWPRLKPSKYAVICVPTPSRKNGAADTSIVEEVIRRSGHEYYLIKSTVPPGTTKRLAEALGKRLAFSPEYLGEGGYQIPFWKDYPHPTEMKLHSFHIFGGPREVTGEWIKIWQPVAGWGAIYAQTDSTTAELCKYMKNAFLATKKIFCDEFYDLAKALGVDYHELKELWLLDGRMGRAMTMIYPQSRGFGGKCLPKDVLAIVQLAEKVGCRPELLKQVLAINRRLRRKIGE